MIRHPYTLIRSRTGIGAALLLFSLSLAAVAAPEKGWLSLFDGKTLTGWERKAVHGGHGGVWTVENGLIVGNQEPDHQGGLLGTTTAYGDFEVELDFQADYPVDTGLFLRSAPNGNGYQVTIDYRPGGTVGDLYVPYSGGFVAQDKDWESKYNKTGWNHLKAKIVGQPPHITVWLNGKQTVDFTDTKVRVGPTGYLGLQVHGGQGAWGDTCRVRYKNLRIRPLATAAPIKEDAQPEPEKKS